MGVVIVLEISRYFPSVKSVPSMGKPTKDFSADSDLQIFLKHIINVLTQLQNLLLLFISSIQRFRSSNYNKYMNFLI